MNGSQGRIARTATRLGLGAVWTAGAAMALRETLAGPPPEPFVGFVVLPAALLAGACAAMALDALLARGVGAGRTRTTPRCRHARRRPRGRRRRTERNRLTAAGDPGI